MRYPSLIALLLTFTLSLTAQNDCEQLEYDVYFDSQVTTVPSNLQTPDNEVECYEITAATEWQFGTIWSDSQIDLNNSFEYSYYVNLGNNDAGADGIMFVLNGSPLGVNATGAAGGNLGYGGTAGTQGIAQSIGIEFDTWYNANFGDLTDDHVNLNIDGYMNTNAGAAYNLGNIEDGQYHLVVVSWNAVTNTLQTYFDGTLVINTNIDLINDVMGGDPLVWVGFTGSTGGAFNSQVICDISVTYIEVCNGLDDDCDGLIDEDLDTQAQIDSVICDGQTVSIAGSTFSTSGMYTEVIPNANGCDSTIFLDLEVLPLSLNSVNADICEGESYIQGGSTYSTAGQYTDIFMDAQGCDSTVTVNLSVHNQPETTEEVAICEGDSHQQGSSTYTTSGTYTDVYPSFWNCDSTVITELQVLNVDTNPLFVQICPTSLFSTPQAVYSQVGVYEEYYQATNGCDSVVIISLSHLPEASKLQQRFICEGGEFSIGNSTYNSTGTYVDTLQAANGCDSVVTTVLEIIDALDISDTILCEGVSYHLDMEPFPFHEVVGADMVNGDVYIFNTADQNSVWVDLDGCQLEAEFSIGFRPVYQSETYAYSACRDEVINLAPRFQQLDHSWTNGLGTGPISVTQSGTYIVEYQDDCGGFLDLTEVQFLACDCEVYLPNSFSPDGDGLNEMFSPVFDCPLVDYQFSIYDRFGRVVFSSTDPGQRWNGGPGDYYQSDGVYNWVLTYRNQDDSAADIQRLRGTVTILR